MNRNTGIEKNKRIYLYALLIGYACLLMFFAPNHLLCIL